MSILPPGQARTDAVQFWRQFVVDFYFDKPGHKIEGVILKYWSDGPGDAKNPVLKIQTDNGLVFVVTARQARLKSELVAQVPAIGDHISILYQGDATKAAPGFTKAKEFVVEVQRRGSRAGERTAGELGEVPADNATRPGTKTK